MDSKEKKQTEFDILREVVGEIAGTKAGKILLKHLHRDCGFIDTDSRMNGQTGEINPMAIVHNAAQRNVYVRLRRFIPKEFLLEIEH